MSDIIIQFTVISELTHINKTIAEIMKLLNGYIVSAKSQFNIEIILKEILNNISEHGTYDKILNRNEHTINVKITINKSSNTLLMEIMDKGKKWCIDEQLYNNKILTDDLYSIAGRGIMIVKNISSFFNIQRKNNKNITTILLTL